MKRTVARILAAGALLAALAFSVCLSGCQSEPGLEGTWKYSEDFSISFQPDNVYVHQFKGNVVQGTYSLPEDGKFHCDLPSVNQEINANYVLEDNKLTVTFYNENGERTQVFYRVEETAAASSQAA